MLIEHEGTLWYPQELQKKGLADTITFPVVYGYRTVYGSIETRSPVLQKGDRVTVVYPRLIERTKGLRLVDFGKWFALSYIYRPQYLNWSLPDAQFQSFLHRAGLRPNKKYVKQGMVFYGTSQTELLTELFSTSYFTFLRTCSSLVRMDFLSTLRQKALLPFFQESEALLLSLLFRLSGEPLQWDTRGRCFQKTVSSDVHVFDTYTRSSEIGYKLHNQPLFINGFSYDYF